MAEPKSAPPARSALRQIRLVTYVGLAAIAGLWGGWWIAAACGWLPQPTMMAAAPIGGPFTLVDHNGRTVTDQTFRGRWMLVFFGYTRCPDACPMALSEMSQALDALGPLAERVQPLFVSVDTERDTPETMRGFFDAFDPRILGLAGSAEQVAAAARAYRAFYRRVDQGSDYTMDHSTLLYVMGPDGRYVTAFNHQTGGDVVGQRLRALVAGAPAS